MSDELSDLLSKDPMEYTDQDLNAIVTKLRQMRSHFKTTGKATPAAAKPKKASKSGDLNIEVKF